MAKDSVRVSFHGAAGTVTGSKYLVEYQDKKILIDCGIFQGPKEMRMRNWEAPTFKPAELDCIVLTHAHIDHTGYLPLVTKYGFKGPIFCSAATKDLLQLLLPDAAHLQEQEAFFSNKHGTSRHKPAKPLFDLDDAIRSLSQLRSFDTKKPFEISKGAYITTSCAGHILGSLSFNLDIGGKRITFSGDVGRYGSPILPDPQPIALGDLLIVESTYGDRLHAAADMRTELAKVVNDAHARQGTIVIPSFAIGRTQTLLYELAELERANKIPVIPVYVDSPMAVDATEIYKKYHNDFDQDAQNIISKGELPLKTEQTYMCHSVDESKALNVQSGTRIIISASGMATGGRVLHHLKNLMPDEKNIILFVGFQGQGTRGQIIQSGAKEVRIFSKYVPVNAEVRTISGLSGHGDKSELSRWLKSCSGTPSIVRVVHGEPKASSSFSKILKEDFKWDAVPAKHLESLEL